MEGMLRPVRKSVAVQHQHCLIAGPHAVVISRSYIVSAETAVQILFRLVEGFG